MSLEHLIVRALNALQRRKQLRPKGRDLVLGATEGTGRPEPVIWPEGSRPTHLGIIGLSGVGKSYLLENLIRQDIKHGTGFALFDAHGDLAENIVAHLAEQSGRRPDLRDRVVLVEPFDERYSVGFNPLEPSEHTSLFLQANEVAHILRRRWEAKSFGPRTEELLRNAIYALSSHRLTLLELPAFLTNKSFRASLVRALRESSVVDYWKNRYESASERMKAVLREPLLTRISAFLTDPQIRDMVGQEKSTFSFQDAIRKGLAVVINLSKGRLGENSAVLGSLLFTKLELDVLAQARVPPDRRKLFAVYADELQSLVGASFTTLVAEARKYLVSIAGGHQFWRQLPPDARAGMLSVGSRVYFRLNYHDAAELAGEIEPNQKEFYASVLTMLPRGQAIFRTGAERPVVFVVESRGQSRAEPSAEERLRQHARKAFAAPRETIRRDIERRLQRKPGPDLNRFLNRPAAWSL